ncbi:hypothetical protein H6G33_10520 [Calothrix sp. FACHB-1219]|uniref:hypothetical protein n=1 Tax=unclassified Calothrix TaxID=2619626 RepID=UPI001681F42D|nr:MULTISPECIES: hypothetical protein [unclassified Calothrix]MBD2201781.1 hypothetical protein [Calothrix sp. FACHB-168]MBD2217467.1 hypothetical protein [Calothrix sp. FACHB-1219]
METSVIKWAALPHCPEGQFSKPRETDAGFDIKAAETVIVNPYDRLDFSWEDVGFVDNLREEIPDLFQASYNEELFYNKGVRFKGKVLVRYIDSSYSIAIYDLIKDVLPSANINEIDDNSLVIGSNHEDINNELITSINKLVGVIGCERKVVLQRKKYKPLLIKTGIVIQPQELSWNGLYLRSSMSKYAISQPHSVGIVDMEYDNELFISVYSLEGITVITRGERIAQLVPHFIDKNIVLDKVERDNLIKFNRGGFGHSGTSLKVA